MAKANGKAKKSKPLRREAQKDVRPFDRAWFETETLPPPVLESEADCARYLQEDLPKWIDAISAIFSSGVEYSVAGTLFWNLRDVVRAVGYALETGIAPVVHDAIDDEYRSALLGWATTAFENGPDMTDGLLLLKAAQRGLGKPEGCEAGAGERTST